MAKYIEVPNSIQMVNVITGELSGQTVTFKDFLIGALLGDAAWSRMGVDGVMALGRILDAAKKLPQPWLQLESTDYEKLLQIVKTPTDGRYGGFMSHGIVQLRAFLSAVIDAKDEIKGKDEKLEPIQT